MTEFLDVNRTAFTVFEYEMSYLELGGTLLYIASVWLVARNNILTWPIGNVAVILFGILFYQIQLYSDVVEQIYFLLTGFYGWWLWARLRSNASGIDGGDSSIRYMTFKGRLLVVAATAAGTGLMGYFMSNVHNYLSDLFPQPAAFPYLDAWTTMMSFTAQILMAHKRIESWWLWIAVDIIGIGLYFARGVKLISLLYVVFLVLAIRGLYRWRLQHELSSDALKRLAVTAPEPAS